MKAFTLISVRPKISQLALLSVAVFASCFCLPKVVWFGLNCAGQQAICEYHVSCQRGIYYAKQSANAIFFYTAAFELAKVAAMNQETQLESLFNLAFACEQVGRYDLVELYDLEILNEFERHPEKHKNGIPVLLDELIKNCEHTGYPERAAYYRGKLNAWKGKLVSG
jgi:hypothetical protein